MKRKKTLWELYKKQKEVLDLYQITKFGEEILKRKNLAKYVTRPGLALTGFFEHFEPERIQLIGETELLYLKSIENNDEKIENVEEFFKFNIPAIIIAKNKNIPSYFIEYGVKYKVPIYQSSLNTDELYLKLRKYLDELFSISAIVSASLIAVYNVGILIEGNEGYGKSETTLELIKNGHQFVCDDNVLIVNKNGTLFGEAAKTYGGEYQYPMKIKGIGEIFIDDIFGVKSILKNKEINLRVIFSKEDYDEFIDNKFNFDFKDELDPLLGVKIPVMNINISTNRSIATLIEMIAIQYLSKYVFVNRKL